MNKEIKTVLKKTTKIAAVTCIAASAVAIMTSGVALKAIGEGGKYLANAVKKIVNENVEAEDTIEASAEEADVPAQERDETL